MQILATMSSSAVYRLRRRVAHWILPERPAAAVRPRTVRAMAPPPQSAEEEKLAALFSGAEPRLAGRIQFLDLQPIKDRYPGNWDEAVARVDRLVRTRIERRLAPGDVHLQIRPAEHVIVFAGLTMEAAQLKCAVLAREIAQAVLGEADADTLSVGANVVRLQADAQVTDAHSLDRAVAQAEPHGARLRIGGPDPAEDDDEDAALDAARTLAFTYEPMWRPGRGVISSYRCRASSAAGGRSTLQRDFAILAAAAKQVRRLMLDGRTLLVAAPVAFETLARYNDRREYLRLLAEVPVPARRLLLCELGGLADGVPQSRLQEIVAPLRQHCRAVLAELPATATGLSNVQEASIAAVGIDLACGEPGPEQSLFQQIARFRELARRAGLASYARGVSSLSLAAHTAAAGYDYIAGSAVMAPLEEPQRIVRFGLAELYRPRL